jgi:hypothetical protein
MASAQHSNFWRLRVFLTLLFAFLLTACGGGGSGTSATDNGSNSSSTSIATDNNSSNGSTTTTTPPSDTGGTSGTPDAGSGGNSDTNTGSTDNTSGSGDTVTNHAPAALPVSSTVTRNNNVTINLNAIDINGDKLTYTLVTQPTHGTLSGISTTGTVTYTPSSGYTGSDSFEYKVSDGKLESATAKVTLTVKAPSGSGGSGGGSGGSSGGGSSGGGGTVNHTEAKGIVQLGYIADGDVSVYSVSNLTTPVCTTKTSSSLDPAQAGQFSCKLPNLQNNAYYVVVVTNGTDIDPNDDGIIDDVANRKTLLGKVHLVASGEQLAKGQVRVTFLSDMVYRNLKDSLLTDSADAVRAKYQKRAGELIDDIDGDGEVSGNDVSQFGNCSRACNCQSLSYA